MKKKRNRNKKQKMNCNNYYSYTYTPVDFSTKTKNSKNIFDLDVNLLIDLLSIQGKSGDEYEVQLFIINWIYKNIKDATVEVDEHGNIYVEKIKDEKECYPSFVAHMDEVNSLQSGRKIINLGNVLVGLNPNTGKTAGCPGDKLIVSLCGNA